MNEDAFLPLSGLQHMAFCARQAALIHVEGLWRENSLTVEGGHLHRIVDDGGAGMRDGVRVHRGVRIASATLGLVGRADLIEFHIAGPDEPGVDLDGDGRLWKPVPVEYKRGKPKAHRADEIQLCAQALCLEEHFDVSVREGALFYGRTRRRMPVPVDEDLRALTKKMAKALHDLVRSGRTPVRTRERKCEQCSLLDICLPPKKRRPTSAAGYVREMIKQEIRSGEDGR